MDSHRNERISEALREELGELIAYEMSDPRVGSATVTEVIVAPGNKLACVRVGFGEGTDRDAALAALEGARSFLKRRLAARLELFRVPELRFEADIGTTEAGRLDRLLKRARRGRPRE